MAAMCTNIKKKKKKHQEKLETKRMSDAKDAAVQAHLQM